MSSFSFPAYYNVIYSSNFFNFNFNFNFYFCFFFFLHLEVLEEEAVANENFVVTKQQQLCN